MTVIELVPRALREAAARIEQRVWLLSRGLSIMSEGEPPAVRYATREYLTAWRLHVWTSRERVMAQWRAGEITTREAEKALETELARACPPLPTPLKLA